MKAAIVLFFSSFCFMFVAYVSRTAPPKNVQANLKPPVESTAEPTTEPTVERAERYRAELGAKLNRDRIGMEYENAFTARSRRLKQIVNKGDPLSDPMVQGLPFDGEPIRAANRRVEPDHVLQKSSAEAAVQYAVLEKQREQTYGVEAQRQFVRDYVANARAQGYDVRIDHDYNVQVVRGPQSIQTPAPPSRQPQGVEGDHGETVHISDLFRYAPFCSLK